MSDGIVLTPSTLSPPTKAAKLEGAKKAEAAIITAEQIEPHLKACIFARNGVGKTSFAASSNLPTLIIDCNERGYDAVRKRKNVSIYKVEYWEQVDWIYWYLRAGKHPYKVVCVDTVTMLANICMKWVLGDVNSRDPSIDPQMPDKRHWGKVGELMKTTITNFRNLPMHVIFNAQEKRTSEEDDDGGTVVEIHPELSPSPRSTLLSCVAIIGRMYVKEVHNPKTGKTVMERRMLLGNHPVYVAKNRFPELKSIERNPTLGDFLHRIYGEETDAGSEQDAS